MSSKDKGNTQFPIESGSMQHDQFKHGTLPTLCLQALHYTDYFCIFLMQFGPVSMLLISFLEFDPQDNKEGHLGVPGLFLKTGAIQNISRERGNIANIKWNKGTSTPGIKESVFLETAFKEFYKISGRISK